MEQIFQAEYNESDKIMIMIKFTAEMITSRQTFSECTFEDVYNSFLKNLELNYTYYRDNNYKIDLFISLEKLKKIDKTGDLNNFLDTNPNNYKIVNVYKSIPKIITMFNNKSNWELIFNNEMMSSRRDHHSNPKFIQLTIEEQRQVQEEYNLEKRNICILKRDDKMTRYYGLQPGEIIEIDRPSITTGHGLNYRIVE